MLIEKLLVLGCCISAGLVDGDFGGRLMLKVSDMFTNID